MMNLTGLANPKLVGVAVIVGVSFWGISHLVSTIRGDDIKISKEGYSAQPHKKTERNTVVNKLCEE